jgi:hypothetical protein
MTFEGIHRIDQGSIRFAFYPDGHDGGRILADISEQTLSHIFGGRIGKESWVDLCARHGQLNTAEAVLQYRIDPSRPIELSVSDLAAFQGSILPLTPPVGRLGKRPDSWQGRLA